MDLTDSELMSIVNDIRNSCTPNKEKYFACKYPDFKAKYPALFGAALNDSFSLRFLSLMLSQRNEVLLNKKDLDACDKVVYDTLREAYITPVIDKLGGSSS
jgi:hypothetical protein